MMKLIKAHMELMSTGQIVGAALAALTIPAMFVAWIAIMPW